MTVLESKNLAGCPVCGASMGIPRAKATQESLISRNSPCLCASVADFDFGFDFSRHSSAFRGDQTLESVSPRDVHLQTLRLLSVKATNPRRGFSRDSLVLSEGEGPLATRHCRSNRHKRGLESLVSPFGFNESDCSNRHRFGGGVFSIHALSSFPSRLT